ncbi:MAG TPA: hypothetical protein VFW83_10840 [Bryobacteraceae bacterium]|nr:hypothetical protein [Bryobacteraceae bacterium]
MARKLDLGIFWVVVLAAVFWAGIWQHDRVASYVNKAYGAGMKLIYGAPASTRP